MSGAHDTTFLLDRWHEGDHRALDRLLREHLGWIEQRVRSRLGEALRSRAEVGDLVQETLVEFLRYGPRFRIHDGRHFRSLLACIAENALRHEHDKWAAQRRRLLREHPLDRESVLRLDGPTPSEVVSASEEEAWLRLGLELMPNEARSLVVAHDFEAKTHTEIAGTLGVEPAAVRKRYQRAVRLLAGLVARLKAGQLDELDDADAGAVA